MSIRPRTTCSRCQTTAAPPRWTSGWLHRRRGSIRRQVAACTREVLAIWQRTADFRGTQLVFCDQRRARSKAFSVYEDLKEGLLEAGIPEREIAFIHDAETDVQKAKLVQGGPRGRAVLLGSTGKMGVGTNVQTRLVALHHLDAPWRPCDVEQREGCILRQGNEWGSRDLPLRLMSKASMLIPGRRWRPRRGSSRRSCAATKRAAGDRGRGTGHAELRRK